MPGKRISGSSSRVRGGCAAYWADMAIGASDRLLVVDAGLPTLEHARLSGREAASGHALLDVRLLVDIALHVGLHPLR